MFEVFLWSLSLPDFDTCFSQTLSKYTNKPAFVLSMHLHEFVFCVKKSLVHIVHCAGSLTFSLDDSFVSIVTQTTQPNSLYILCIWICILISQCICVGCLSFSSDDIHHGETTPVSALLFVQTTLVSSGWEFSPKHTFDAPAEAQASSSNI